MAYQCIDNNAKTKVRIRTPVIFPQQLTDGEVKRRTNWENETSMIQYIMVICNGDFYKMEQKVSTLTWFEEWFLFFEVIWGRTLLRWEDVKGVYQLGNKDIAIKILDSKLKKV